LQKQRQVVREASRTVVTPAISCRVFIGSMYIFHSLFPLSFIFDLKKSRSYLAHSSLECAKLSWLIAPWIEVLQIPENISHTSLRMINHPGCDLLPYACKRIILGAPPIHTVLSILLLAHLQERYCRINYYFFGRKRSGCTISQRK